MILSEEQNRLNKILSTIGICVKAGKVIFGIPLICEALKDGNKNKPLLIAISNDISDNSRKRITDRCNFYSTQYINLPITAEYLGKAVGKTRPVGAIGITDSNLCIAVSQCIKNAEKTKE